MASVQKCIVGQPSADPHNYFLMFGAFMLMVHSGRTTEFGAAHSWKKKVTGCEIFLIKKCFSH